MIDVLFYSCGITYAPDSRHQLDGAHVSERHADDPRRSNGPGQDAAIHRIYCVSSPFTRQTRTSPGDSTIVSAVELADRDREVLSLSKSCPISRYY